MNLAFAEPDQFQEHIRAAKLEVVVTACGDYRAELQRVELNRLGLQRGRQSLPNVGRVTTPADRSLILFLSGAEEAPAGAGKIEIRPGDIVLSPEQSQDYYRLTRNTGWASLSSPSIDLGIAAQSLGGSDLLQAYRSRIRRPPAPLMARLQTLHKAVGDLATSAPDVLARPEVVKALEESVLRATVACLAGDPSSEWTGSGHHDTTIMRRLEQVLEANEQRPLYLTELCAKVGVSARVLRAQCQQHLGMSPHRYLWLRRMHLARRALTMADPVHATVTNIANDYGFGELGRFAVTYRALFGELPSAALSRPPDARRPETTCLERTA
ncbi:MAG TPA: helix-turn-helix transcriptional regulator [Acetobacteraceae bacterium]|nr:helix-turn-helix transcriptional regulator [Acetobacteraceae bacterium]